MADQDFACLKSELPNMDVSDKPGTENVATKYTINDAIIKNANRCVFGNIGNIESGQIALRRAVHAATAPGQADLQA